MARLDHYFTPFQTYVVLEAEKEDGRLDFPDASFDLVVNNMVFEHVEDLDAVLAEIQRVLKPGGRILLFDKFLRRGQRAWLPQKWTSPPSSRAVSPR